MERVFGVTVCQCIKVWKERHSQRDVETSHLRDGQLQTRNTRDDGPGPSHKKDSRPTREGHEQDGQVHCCCGFPLYFIIYAPYQTLSLESYY